ncbi:MAG: S8 family peptidase [Candidatus Kapaibacterium sp.]
MKNTRILLIAAGIALASILNSCSFENTPSASSPQEISTLPPATPVTGQVISGQYIVVLKTPFGIQGTAFNVQAIVADLSKAYGIPQDDILFTYTAALKGFAAKLSATQAGMLQKDARVAYVEQDQVAHAIAVQTNPTWGLDRIDQLSLGLSNSYTYNYTGSGVDAYIIDTGILTSHTDFGGRAVFGFNAIGGVNADSNGHGTHVAGTVGGTVYGVAKGVSLIAVKVLNASGSGAYSQVIAGVDYVTSNHTTNPAVANMSLGGGTSTALDAAVQNSIADGVTYCVAAGNSSANAANYSPARVTQAITVGATSSTDGWASFSNYGSVVDVLAPGVNITSAWYTSNTAAAVLSGTSMASPHVAGCAALYLEQYPTATPATVHTAMVNTSSPNKISGVPTATVNALVNSLRAGSGPAAPAAPALSSPADGATNVARRVTLTWAASAGAQTYQVQVSKSSTFASIAYSATNLTTTSATTGTLSANTTHYWRVRATNAKGTGSYSATRSYRTGSR